MLRGSWEVPSVSDFRSLGHSLAYVVEDLSPSASAVWLGVDGNLS